MKKFRIRKISDTHRQQTCTQGHHQHKKKIINTYTHTHAYIDTHTHTKQTDTQAGEKKLQKPHHHNAMTSIVNTFS